ncbi:hypothetical protein [Clostridium botulinum]|uniref:hypothetical protein n=1 Tax=Clostridium botulinum TaxID=1491 RepID=UPI000774AC04|nr:hypothetical protein [Clostridium botulinum]NFE94370.1 hypothetical protein [Clostridium botulinum]NFL37816.1 hypothetical protein [Clostridium botulinum]NFL64106.1 hypothetical protein [Clostridium botulinum]NFN07762.1 hypothetical protein [Clostridium botulinum]NFN23997.1 hypothetical protein [Clostridium botulinum]
MGFRESISYSKNFLTGRKVEKVKQKLIMPVQGIATVKLYDDLTGKQVYEAKSENRITAVLANPAFLDGFYYPMLENNQEYLLKKIFTTYPFRVLSLTTGDIPEDPYDYFTWGSLIGYADAWYTYSGDSELMGTVNKGEWLREDKDGKGIKHFVFDFPTHAANGTFKSIYWTGGQRDDSSAQTPRVNCTYKKRTVMEENYYIPKYNLCTDNHNLYALDPDKTTVNVYDKFSIEKKNDITLKVKAKAIAYDGEYFWVLINDGSFKKLDKSFNVLESYPKSAKLPDNLVYDVEYYDIVVTESNVYITYKGCINRDGNSKDYRSCIAMYDKDGTFVRKAEVYTGTSSRLFITRIPNDKLYVIVNGRSDIQLNMDLSIYGSTNLGYYSYYSIGWDKETQTLFVFDDYRKGSIDEYYIVPASAHTLLPESVTKTPVNTMKIQYDFTCDYVNPLDMPAH